MPDLRRRITRLRAVSATLGAAAASLLGGGTALAAPPWEAPVDLSATGKSAFFPQVGIASSGEATAVWNCVSNCGPQSVFRSSRSTSGAWSEPQLANPGESTYVPQVSVAPNGFVGTIWWRGGFDTDHIIQTSFRSGGTWSGVTDLTNKKQEELEGYNGSYFPHIAVNSKGDQVAIWQECFSATDDECTTQAPITESNGEYVLRASRRLAGEASWSPVADLSTKSETAIKAKVTVDEKGNAIVVWEGDDLPTGAISPKVIYAAVRRVNDPSWSKKQISPVGNEAGEPEIAFDGAGNATALWHSRVPPGGTFLVESSVLNAGGATSWSSPGPVSQGQSAFEPQLAVNPTGAAVAIWREGAGPTADIKGRLRTGGAWSGPELEVSAASIDAREPRLGIDAAGDAVAIWTYVTGSKRLIQGSLLPGGGSWTAPVDLSVSGQNAEEPWLAMNASGSAVAVWERPNGANEIIQSSFLDASLRLQSHSIPAHGAAGTPVNFSVTPVALWPGVTTKWEFGDGKTAVGNAVSHTYAKGRTYKVTVTSTDGRGNSATATGDIVVVGGKVRAPRMLKVIGGRAWVPLSCNRAGACNGKLELVRTAKGKRSVLGRAGFNIPAGKKRTVKVALSKSAKKLLANARNHQLGVVLKGAGVQRRAVVLKETRPRR
jgi:hypothetical protein